MKKALALGLEPYPVAGYQVDHFPVIEIVPIPHPPFEGQLKTSSHLLFTSKTAVDLFPYSEKQVVAVGKGTAKRAGKKGYNVVAVAEDETQEGVCLLVEKLIAPTLFWPRSDKARTVVSTFCKERGIPLHEHPIYTVKGKQVPLPDLDWYDGLFFSSPTTVEAFFALKPTIPPHLDLIPIGPITKDTLKFFVG